MDDYLVLPIGSEEQTANIVRNRSGVVIQGHRYSRVMFSGKCVLRVPFTVGSLHTVDEHITRDVLVELVEMCGLTYEDRLPSHIGSDMFLAVADVHKSSRKLQTFRRANRTIITYQGMIYAMQLTQHTARQAIDKIKGRSR